VIREIRGLRDLIRVIREIRGLRDLIRVNP
jgi:hypothetical protein